MNPCYRGDSFLIVRGASGPPCAVGGARQVLVFQCYLDDSGTTGLPIVTMAGFIASQDVWENLEKSFDEILNRFNVPILHAKEFHDTKPPFHGWNKIKKRSFAEELFSSSRGRMMGLSVTVRKADFLKSQKETGQCPKMSPIGICFSAIMTKIVTDPHLSNYIKSQGVSFLVESGNKNNGGIEKFFHTMSKLDFFAGSLRSISFLSKSSCRAIQIADFFSFYSRREMRNHDRFSGQLALPACPFLQIMQKHGPIWQMGAFGPSKGIGKLDDMNGVSDLQALMGARPS